MKIRNETIMKIYEVRNYGEKKNPAVNEECHHIIMSPISKLTH